MHRPAREPFLGLGFQRARLVRDAIGYQHPTELPIEVLAHMRGALVRPRPATGTRANVIRIGERAIVGIAGDLGAEQRRWAVAHELGHFELHPGVNYVGLCTGEDMLFDYRASGREQEANAFAAELLMPAELYEPRCDIAKVSWTPIKKLAEEFQVSLTAAALRLLMFTCERMAVICCKQGEVAWSQATRDFGPRLKKGTKLDSYSLAFDFFKNGSCGAVPETVAASAWVPGARDELEVMEHVFPMPRLGMAMCLVWFPVS
jgi:Zn-dependent peptidase ImmA (M78 family)